MIVTPARVPRRFPTSPPLQLRDILSLEVTRNAGAALVDFYAWAHRMSLDVIGEAGACVSTSFLFDVSLTAFFPGSVLL